MARRGASRSHGRLGAVAVLVCFGCTSADDRACEVAPARGAHAVRYVLGWDDDTGEEGARRSYVSDLGYAVTLTDGALVDYAIQLVPCDHEERAAYRSVACEAGTPGASPSGHGTGESDDSLVANAIVEPLLGGEVDLGQAVVGPAWYCRAHHLAGPATTTTVGGELGTTLWLEGTYRAPGSPSDVAFRMATSSAWGAFARLEEDGAPVVFDSGARSVVVTVTRRRGGMFDGVALAEVAPDLAARAVLRNLVGGLAATLATE
ncbi:MAG: hypothetical protein FJ096_16560 [Deltaproteobacteria bacterium]|nr:hypothetical protein [Deltaproteobacteria bacterium]